jgi:hypothetical protein
VNKKPPQPNARWCPNEEKNLRSLKWIRIGRVSSNDLNSTPKRPAN